MYLPKTMMFGKDRFSLSGEYLNKTTADWEVGKLRSRKWRTHIVRSLGLYGVYKHR